MRHNKAGFKLKRDVSARRALLRNIVTSVILEERVITTVPKAKAAKPIVDQIITLAKREKKEEQLHARRQAASYLMTPASVQKLFDQIGPRFATRNGGSPAWFALVSARATVPKRLCWNSWVPNWSAGPPTAPSAAKRNSRRCRKAAMAASRQSPN